MKLLISDARGAAGEEIHEALRACAAAAMQAEGLSGRFFAAVHIVGDGEIQKLNRGHRGMDRATDVLSFPAVAFPAGKTAGDCPLLLMQAYDDSENGIGLGDVVISSDHAKSQAEAYGHSLAREYAYLLTHGLFHLMGYDHMTESDRAKMRAREEEALCAAGITRRPADG